MIWLYHDDTVRAAYSRKSRMGSTTNSHGFIGVDEKSMERDSKYCFLFEHDEWSFVYGRICIICICFLYDDFGEECVYTRIELLNSYCPLIVQRLERATYFHDSLTKVQVSSPIPILALSTSLKCAVASLGRTCSDSICCGYFMYCFYVLFLSTFCCSGQISKGLTAEIPRWCLWIHNKYKNGLNSN